MEGVSEGLYIMYYTLSVNHNVMLYNELRQINYLLLTSKSAIAICLMSYIMIFYTINSVILVLENLNRKPFICILFLKHKFTITKYLKTLSRT